ncbi:MAG: hypothetical protein K9N06_06315 [Candidatus Cloacimonetes bacterium]|nr:hypothetical protein [Candidatus Cloacimonadota bacterium]
MKKLMILLLLILTCFAGVSKVQNKIADLTLTEVAGEYLYEYDVLKTVIPEGKCISYAFAKNSGDLVLLNNNNISYFLHYLDIEGNILWTKEFKNDDFTLKLEISENGATILLKKINYDRLDYFSRNILYDRDGTELFDLRIDEQELILSPSGNYLVPKPLTGELRDAYFYDRKGDSFYPLLTKNNIITKIAYHFCESDKVILISKLAGSKSQLLTCYQLIDRSCVELWENSYNPLTPLDIFNSSILTNGNWTGLTLSGNIIIFNSENGEIISELTDFGSDWFLTSEGNIILIKDSVLYSYTLMNTGTFRRNEIIDSFPYSNFVGCLELDDIYFVNIRSSFRYMRYAKRYLTELLANGSRYKIEEVFYRAVTANSDYIVAIKLWNEYEEDLPYDPQNYSKVTIFKKR